MAKMRGLGTPILSAEELALIAEEESRMKATLRGFSVPKLHMIHYFPTMVRALYNEDEFYDFQADFAINYKEEPN